MALQLERLVKMINREPKSIVMLMMEADKPKRPVKIQREASELLGFSTARALYQEHPGLSSDSIKSYLERSLSDVVDGDNKKGYVLKDPNVKSIFSSALQYTITTGVSMYEILTTDIGAPVVAKIFEKLSGVDSMKLTDLTNACHASSVSSVSSHAQRLAEVGLTKLEKYDQAAYFIKPHECENFDLLEEFFSKVSGGAHKSNRAKLIIDYLRSTNRPASAREISENLPYKYSRSNQSHTEYVLHCLAELGYVEPVNGFHGGQKLSDVSLTSFGKGLWTFFDNLRASRSKAVFCPRKASAALEIYNLANTRRKSEQARSNQIIKIVRTQPGLNEDEIDKKLGVGSRDYLRKLHSSGVIERKGTGVINDRFTYFIANKYSKT